MGKEKSDAPKSALPKKIKEEENEDAIKREPEEAPKSHTRKRQRALKEESDAGEVIATCELLAPVSGARIRRVLRAMKINQMQNRSFRRVSKGGIPKEIPRRNC